MTDQTDQTEVDVQDAPEADATDDQQQESTPDESTPQEGEFDADKARDKIRKLNSEAKNLRERAKKADEAEQNATNAAKENSTLKAENLRLKVAIKAQLPAEIAERLRGDTEEELLEDAEKLLTLVGGKRPPSQQPREQLRGGGDPTAPMEETDLNKIADRMFSN